MKTVTLEFNITEAEKTIAWFYSGVRQPQYQKAKLALFDVLHNGVEAHRAIKAMLFKCRGYMADVKIFSAEGYGSVRIDDWYGWGKYQ